MQVENLARCVTWSGIGYSLCGIIFNDPIAYAFGTALSLSSLGVAEFPNLHEKYKARRELKRDQRETNVTIENLISESNNYRLSRDISDKTSEGGSR